MATIFPLSPVEDDVFGIHRFDGTSWKIIGTVLTTQYVPLSEKGEAEGVAELDISGFVPVSQTSPDVRISTGGATGQTLTKVDGTDYNTEWTTPVISIDAATTSVAGLMSSADKTKLDAVVTGSGVATGGATGQTLTKVDGTDYNTEWTTPAPGGVTSFNSDTGAITGVNSISGTAPIVSTGTTTPVISIDAATTSVAGSMSSADKTKLDAVVTGSGVAAGGTANQVLKKIDSDDYNTTWGTIAGAVYQTTAPVSPEVGDVWVDSDASAGVINQNDYILKTDLDSLIINPYVLMGA